jgi:ATP-binding cassette subfamily B protein
VLFVDGRDLPSLGMTHRHGRLCLVPQFHENHLFSGPLAFNLLLGREWPASASSLEEAREVCLALDLGPLLERMPAGLMQPVGDGGWSLSDGERSRIFLARALLQRPGMVALDESFASMDPGTAACCLQTTLAHPGTLVVIRHD